MSDRAFKQFLIVLAVALLAVGVGSVCPFGLAGLGAVGLVAAMFMSPEDVREARE